jgi:hypothetical protein
VQGAGAGVQSAELPSAPINRSPKKPKKIKQNERPMANGCHNQWPSTSTSLGRLAIVAVPLAIGHG